MARNSPTQLASIEKLSIVFGARPWLGAACFTCWLEMRV